MNGFSPRVSIITPSYQQGQFIDETILSVAGQDYDNIEHIVVDGASTDKTVEILKEYQSKYQLKWTSEKDSGQTEAINKGIELSSGDIIGWINSDDTYLPGAVKKAVSFFIENPEIDWVYGDAFWIDENNFITGLYKGEEFDLCKLICEGMYIPQPTIFVRRSLLEKIGRLDETLHTTMDYDYCIRLGTEGKAGYLSVVLATRRIHAEAKTSKNRRLFYLDALRCLDKFYALDDLPGRMVKNKKYAYGNRYRIGANNFFLQGDYRESMQLIKTAIKTYKRYSIYQFLSMLLMYLQCAVKKQIVIPGFRNRLRNKALFPDRPGKIIDWKRGIFDA